MREHETARQRTGNRLSRVDAAALRRAMGLFPTGVVILTTGRGERAEGMTVNAVVSVSLEPLLVLVSVHKMARLSRKLETEGNFALSILAEDQRELSRLFASPDRPSGTRMIDTLCGGCGRTGAPLVEGVLGAVECELDAVYPGGDHNLFVGRVVAVHLGDEEKGPLVFHRGTFPSFTTELCRDPNGLKGARAKARRG